MATRASTIEVSTRNGMRTRWPQPTTRNGLLGARLFSRYAIIHSFYDGGPGSSLADQEAIGNKGNNRLTAFPRKKASGVRAKELSGGLRVVQGERGVNISVWSRESNLQEPDQCQGMGAKSLKGGNKSFSASPRPAPTIAIVESLSQRAEKTTLVNKSSQVSQILTCLWHTIRQSSWQINDEKSLAQQPSVFVPLIWEMRPLPTHNWIFYVYGTPTTEEDLSVLASPSSPPERPHWRPWRTILYSFFSTGQVFNLKAGIDITGNQ